MKTVGSAVRAGVGLAPEERKSQALLLDEPIWRNVTLAALRHYPRIGFSNAGAETAAARDVTANLALHPADVRRRARTLSGGNQQKVVLARWLVGRDNTLKLLLLDEPTRGVDVGARTELYGLIRRLAERGVAVLLVSSEVPEVLGLADRVARHARGPDRPRSTSRRSGRRRRPRSGDGRLDHGRAAGHRITRHRDPSRTQSEGGTA